MFWVFIMAEITPILPVSTNLPVNFSFLYFSCIVANSPLPYIKSAALLGIALSVMKKILFIVFVILASTEVQAQFIEEKSHYISLGLGMSAPYENLDLLQNPGVYAQGEYVLSPASWIDIRPYAGLILTKFKEKDPDEVEPKYRSSANALLLGAKTRITAPVSLVAPYFEIGVGASLGSFETITPYKTIEENGVFLHIPFSLGLEFGSQKNIDFKLTYYFHNNFEQFTGAAALGISYPVGY